MLQSAEVGKEGRCRFGATSAMTPKVKTMMCNLFGAVVAKPFSSLVLGKILWPVYLFWLAWDIKRLWNFYQQEVLKKESTHLIPQVSQREIALS